MGLCKCPKRKVTNLFCFEHKVNVCEHCLVTDHVRCIIKSYLQWLQDSDFDTACCICQDTLEAGEVVRLLCYDVLHVSCAEKFLLAYPPHTAPDGFFCPACHGPFLPPEVAVSPVADQLRTALSGMKDLQKRLHGLSAAVPEQAKTPPTDSRPEPEGKEGRDDPSQQEREIPRSEAHYVNESSVGHSADERLSLDKDPIESDEHSSASDFIATHSGSHPRGLESQPDLPSNIPNELVTETESSSAPLAASTTVSPTAAANLASAVDFTSVDCESTSAVTTATFDSPLFNRESLNNDVVLDVSEEPIALPHSASYVNSVSVPVEDFSTTYPFKGSVSFQSDSGHQSSAFASESSQSWSLTNSSSASTYVAAGSTATARFKGEIQAAPQVAAYSGPNYSTSAQSPFSDNERQYGANARSSSTSYIPRIPQSFPTAATREDDDDHKYRRKPIIEVVRTWLKIFSPPRGRRSTPSLWRRFVIIVLIAVLSLICLALLFHHLGRSGQEDDDPLLDLKANPFVRVDDS